MSISSIFPSTLFLLGLFCVSSIFSIALSKPTYPGFNSAQPPAGANAPSPADLAAFSPDNVYISPSLSPTQHTHVPLPEVDPVVRPPLSSPVGTPAASPEGIHTPPPKADAAVRPPETSPSKTPAPPPDGTHTSPPKANTPAPSPEVTKAPRPPEDSIVRSPLPSLAENRTPPPEFTNAPPPLDNPAAPPPSNNASMPPPPASVHAPPPQHMTPPGDINWWCSKTPHPEPCKFYFTQSKRLLQAPRYRSVFRKTLVELAMDQAVSTRAQAVQFGSSCKGEPRKAAWQDCVKLYDDTVSQLNRTLQGLNPKAEKTEMCTDFDAQTWLSTALTNIETCRLGSEDLKVTDFVWAVMSNKNLSDLISNSLAVNAVLLKNHNHSTGYQEEHFPGWVSQRERRLLLSSSQAKIKANLVVAKDGSGHFRTIQAAINLAARRRIMSRFVIHVKTGVYRENIEVGNNNNNIMLVGDGMRKTLITSGRSVQKGYTTYNSATAGFAGLRFIAKDIAFINSAGPLRGQAVAVRSSSDLSVFYRCAINGYQDTLYIHSQRQFYRECYISGTIDFIFGNAAVVFQNCIILARRPLRGQANVITAQARGDPFQNTGITIHNSRIMAAPDLRPLVRAYNTYLGRPWQAYSRVVILKTFIDGLVSPLGWSPWLRGSKFALNTVFYAEYKNFGPGASTRGRVKWKGFHVINSAAVASRFTVGGLIAGGAWLPNTGVPFNAGL